MGEMLTKYIVPFDCFEKKKKIVLNANVAFLLYHLHLSLENL